MDDPIHKIRLSDAGHFRNFVRVIADSCWFHGKHPQSQFLYYVKCYRRI